MDIEKWRLLKLEGHCLRFLLVFIFYLKLLIKNYTTTEKAKPVCPTICLSRQSRQSMQAQTGTNTANQNQATQILLVL